MNPENRKQIESSLIESFKQERLDLNELKKSIQYETDENTKEEKTQKIGQIEQNINNLQPKIDAISTLSEDDLNSLKSAIEDINKLIKETKEECQILRGQIEGNIVHEMPTTYEILKDSQTCNKLCDIISANPSKFKDIPGKNAEAKLENIFIKIRSSIDLFLQNKFGSSEKSKEIIKNTIAPALERNLMELLRDQGHDANVGMLKSIDKISWDNFIKLCNGVENLSDKATGAYGHFTAWINALDYISVHKGMLNMVGKSKVMSNPLAFQEYLNNPLFKDSRFSPYMSISTEQRNELFQIVDDNTTFSYGITEEEKSQILQKIGNIQVVNSPKTTALIAGMLDKPEKFLQKTAKLQETANGLLDGVNSISPIAKILGVDILGEISKSPAERGFMYTVVDFVCKLIGITGGLEGIMKKWRYDRLDLTPEKDDNIVTVFSKYQELAGENEPISITDYDTCKASLDKFTLHDSSAESSSRGDFLRDSMAENIDIELLSPAVVSECLGADYIKTETITENGKKTEEKIVDVSKITDEHKILLAQKHIQNMKNYYSDDKNFDDLKEFFATIRTVDDMALYMTASLYADKNDVIEGVKAKVFLPENYGILLNGASSQSDVYTGSGKDNLDSTENAEQHQVSEQYIYQKAKDYGMTDNRQIAYVLATVKGECGFKNIKEDGGENKDYGQVDSQTGQAYYGRGFIQLTHKVNYEAYTQIIKESGKIFKNNEGVVIEPSSIDLVNNPDLILQSNDLAAFILIDWMTNGGPNRLEEKKISHYVHDNVCDYYNARQIVNGMSSSPEKYQNYANTYLNKLSTISNETVSQMPEMKESVIIGPELDATNNFEIGGLGNSIMCGFQGYSKKTNFPNMNGIEGKSTRTHPDRFKSQKDVQKYVNDNPGIKSFMLYFGANTENNNQTLYDIKQWSEWLKSEGVQPVLCTCIGEDRHTRLTELNTDIKALGKEQNWPVFDFASLYNDKKISMGGDHPDGVGYSTMAGCINYSLSQ